MLKPILLISIVSAVLVSCQDISNLGDFNSIINNLIQ